MAFPRSFPGFLTALLLLSTLSLSLPRHTPAQTVGYSLEPGASMVFWDDALGIEDTWMWGGALTFELGSRVRLSPFYLTRSGAEADPSRAEDGETPPGDEPTTLDVRHLGVDVDIDLASGAVVPFLRLGGGVLRLDPEERDALERIALTWGAGLRFGFGRAGVRLFAQGNSYRLAPPRLYDPDFTLEGGEEEGDRRNLVAGARLSIPISDGPDEPGAGLTTASAPLGLFAGEMNFADESGLGKQRLAGARAGVAFNPLVSLEGFYWRGVNDDFDAVQDIRGYGGEVRFDLGSGTGVSPFLVAGGARLDFDDEPDETDVEPHEDRTALILGGGLAFRLSDRVALHVSARDYLLDTGGDLQDATDPNELRSNWLYGGGLTVRLGGSTVESRTERLQAERDRLEEEVARLRQARPDTVVRTDTVRMAAGRTLAVDTVVLQQRAGGRIDTLVVGPQRARMLDSTRVEMRQRIRTPGGQFINIPVLDEGLVYIRFGPDAPAAEPGLAGGAIMDRTELRRMIREELRFLAGDTIGLPPGDLEEMEQRILQRLQERPAADTTGAGALPPELVQRLDALEQRLQTRIDRLAAQAAQQEPAPAAGAPGGPATEEEPVEAREESAWDRAGRFDPLSTQPQGGIHLGDETQGVLGVRLDFGPLRPGSPLRFVPEAAVGLGGGDPTLLLMGNLHYRIGSFGARDWEPYLVGGAGFFSPTFVGITTGVGVAFDLRDTPDRDPLRTFVELEGVNLFDRTRLLFGVALPTGG